VASLASRREDITRQLGSLSGVIDALSVPEHRVPEQDQALPYHPAPDERHDDE
jgi:hypothetical protein